MTPVWTLVVFEEEKTRKLESLPGVDWPFFFFFLVSSKTGFSKYFSFYLSSGTRRLDKNETWFQWCVKFSLTRVDIRVFSCVSIETARNAICCKTTRAENAESLAYSRRVPEKKAPLSWWTVRKGMKKNPVYLAIPYTW